MYCCESSHFGLVRRVLRKWKTAHQGLQGKKFQQIMFEFGSPIMFHVCGTVPGSYVPDTWFEGSFLARNLSLRITL